MVPYAKGISKGVKNTSGKVCIKNHFSGGNIIKAPLMVLKGKGMYQKRGIIYSYKFNRLESDEKKNRKVF